ncbi:calcium-binding protein CML19 [Spatholobus suberectus]|nr:calcium-binding protein CML19 [Spatholobus suberectus]
MHNPNARHGMGLGMLMLMLFLHKNIIKADMLKFYVWPSTCREQLGIHFTSRTIGQDNEVSPHTSRCNLHEIISGLLSGQVQSSKSIHYQVYPQKLDSCKRHSTRRNCSYKVDDKCSNVNCVLKRNELNVCVHTSSSHGKTTEEKLSSRITISELSFGTIVPCIPMESPISFREGLCLRVVGVGDSKTLHFNGDGLLSLEDLIALMEVGGEEQRLKDLKEAFGM